MKLLIKVFTIIMILTFVLSVEVSYAEATFEGNRPKVKVLNKKRKISKQSSNYSLRFNTRNINKCPKKGRRKRGFFAFR